MDASRTRKVGSMPSMVDIAGDERSRPYLSQRKSRSKESDSVRINSIPSRNKTRLPLYLCHAPAGTSMKNVIHFDQLVTSRKPQKFDYGVALNMEYYGRPTPPLYKLENVRTDCGIFWSKGDQFVPPENVKVLIKELGCRVKKNHYIDDDHYTHLHFAVAIVNEELLFPDLLEFLGRSRKNIFQLKLSALTDAPQPSWMLVKGNGQPKPLASAQ